MIYFIITLRDRPYLANALHYMGGPNGGTPKLFDTREKANKGIEKMITKSEQNLYCAQPVFIYTNFDKQIIKISAPDGVRVEVTNNHG